MIYFHIPMMGIIGDAKVDLLGGRLRRFELLEFEALDGDWAHGSYFVEKTAIWTIPGDFDLINDDSLSARAGLVRLACMSVLEALFDQNSNTPQHLLKKRPRQCQAKG